MSIKRIYKQIKILCIRFVLKRKSVKCWWTGIICSL